MASRAAYPRSIFALLVAASCACAADGVRVWSNADLKAIEKKMSAGHEKVATESLAVFSRYQMSVLHRTTGGQAELHQTKSDIFYVLSGAATLITGGTIPGQHATQPHEIRGESIAGGQRRRIAPGDWLTIPAGIPHQLLLDPGSDITYAVVKVDGR